MLRHDLNLYLVTVTPEDKCDSVAYKVMQWELRGNLKDNIVLLTDCTPEETEKYSIILILNLVLFKNY
jgi:hypothetical protein